MHTIHSLSTAPYAMQEEAIRQIREGLIGYNVMLNPEAMHEPILIVAREGDVLLGGIAGRCAWNWLRIDFLWLDEKVRGQGIGRQLVEEAEIMARKHKCIGSHLDTFSFQNVDFYRSLGYETFGQLDDYPVGSTHFFLQKRL